MSNTLRRIMGALFCLMLFATAAMAQVNLTPYLQAEVNEVAVLTAQANYLQQQGDPLGAAVVASYIPDHQMQISMLSAAIQQQGGNPSAVQPAGTPLLGTRQQILQHDLKAHADAIDSYQRLARDTDNAVYDRLALLGQSGATRHLHSLQVANGSTCWTPVSLRDANIAALALERGTIADLQAQANVLNTLGDQTTANMLLAMVPQHQQQATNIEAAVRQFGGNPADALAAPAVPLTTRAEIISHFRVADTQVVNTYAIAISSLPPGPLMQTMSAGQTLALTALASLQQLPIV